MPLKWLKQSQRWSRWLLRRVGKLRRISRPSIRSSLAKFRCCLDAQFSRCAPAQKCVGNESYGEQQVAARVLGLQPQGDSGDAHSQSIKDAFEQSNFHVVARFEWTDDADKWHQLHAGQAGATFGRNGKRRVFRLRLSQVKRYARPWEHFLHGCIQDHERSAYARFWHCYQQWQADQLLTNNLARLSKWRRLP